MTNEEYTKFKTTLSNAGYAVVKSDTLKTLVDLFDKCQDSFYMPDEMSTVDEYTDAMDEIIPELCGAIGHDEFVPDQCGMPEHDYCVKCRVRREDVNNEK